MFSNISKSKKIVGVGHSCVDRLCTIENYPEEDGSTHITAMEIQGGGAVATALVAASRLGCDASMIGYTGDDSVSDEILALLRKDNVNTDHVKRLESTPGLQSFVMINPANGARTKFPCRDMLPPIEWDDELENAIKEAAVLHLDGTRYPNAVAAAEIAKKYGTVISLDGCSMQEDNRKNIELASMADILIMNAKYPLRVSGKDSYDEALLEMAGWGPKIVACTLGVKGCKVVIDGEIVNIPAFKVNAIDTTGAGDVFHGAFLTGWLDNMDLLDNLRFASAVSALKCTKIGGRAGIPTKEEALSFMNGYNNN